jgi:hypothetical protein
MRMSHVYLPVMLMTLLQNDGNAPTTKIAKAVLLDAALNQESSFLPQKTFAARLRRVLQARFVVSIGAESSTSRSCRQGLHQPRPSFPLP